MDTITLMHYKEAPDTMKKVRFVYEHPVRVNLTGHAEVEGGTTAYTTKGWPVSKIHGRGHGWVSCVNDDTGERWA